VTHFDEFLGLLGEHLTLVLVSVTLAIVVAVPLGILATRNERSKSIIPGFGNVSQTIPTLAIIALIFPLLGLQASYLHWLDCSPMHFPILTNTVAGLENVDESTVEAARGMGNDGKSDYAKD